jgi:hypothetical protein
MLILFFFLIHKGFSNIRLHFSGFPLEFYIITFSHNHDHINEKSVTLLLGAVTLRKKKFNMRLKMKINRGGHWALYVVMWRALV